MSNLVDVDDPANVFWKTVGFYTLFSIVNI